MGLFSKLNRSGDLASGMAERRGVDLSDRILQNPDAGGQEFRRILMRCAHCSDQEGCAALQAGNDHLDAAPNYCMNKSLFDGA